MLLRNEIPISRLLTTSTCRPLLISDINEPRFSGFSMNGVSSRSNCYMLKSNVISSFHVSILYRTAFAVLRKQLYAK